jgi:hypothetical protein
MKAEAIFPRRVFNLSKVHMVCKALVTLGGALNAIPFAAQPLFPAGETLVSPGKSSEECKGLLTLMS